MKVPNENLKMADSFAKDYDSVVPKNGWYSPDVLFGSLFEFLKIGEKILDLGIGTGLSSVKFKKAGQLVYGIEGSSEMAKICKSKNIAIEIKTHDLTVFPYPYENNTFNHIISCGVLHLLCDLDQLFDESARLICDKGIFGFTIEEFKLDEQVENGNPINGNNILEIINPESGVKSYRHRDWYICNILHKYNFSIVKKFEFTGYNKTEWSDEIFFQLYIVKKH